MKKVALIKFISVLTYISLLSACDGDDGISGAIQSNKTYSISGAAQKGPYVKGSEVLVAKLLPNGQPSSDVTLSEINDDLGNFKFTVSEPGVILISADGVHVNEITGNLSQGRLNLKAIYNVTDGEKTQKAFINILTHMSYKRIQKLMEQGVNVEEAIIQAESEVIASFQTVLLVSDISNFSHLNLYDTDETLANGNAYALALSATIYKYAIIKQQAEPETSVDSQLTWVLNNLADDISEDGDIDNSQVISQLSEATRLLNPAEIKANLENRSFDVKAEKLPVADMGIYIDTDGDGQVNALDNDDDNDGIPDESDIRPYIYSEAPTIIQPHSSEALPSQELIIFEWESSEYAVEYEYTIAKDVEFSEIVTSNILDITSFEISLDTGKYYFRVRAKNSLEFWGGWSVSRALNVGIFTKTYGGQNSDSASAIKETADGGFIIVGSTENGKVRNRGIYLLKIDASGNVEWEQTFDTADTNWGRDVIELTNGNFVLLGTIGSWPNYKLWLIETNHLGEELSDRIIENERSGKLLDLNDGYILVTELFVSETVIDSSTYKNYVPQVVRFDLSHSELWTHVFDESVTDFKYISDIEINGDGDFLMLGTYDPPGVFTNNWGEKAYLYTLSQDGIQNSYVELIDAISKYGWGSLTAKSLENGNIFISVQADGSAHALYDSSGIKLWSSYPNVSRGNARPSVNINANYIEVLEYGERYSNGDWNFGLYRFIYDLDGYVISEQNIINDGSSYERNNGLSQIISASDGGYVVLGSQFSDIQVDKIDSDGNMAQ